MENIYIFDMIFIYKYFIHTSIFVCVYFHNIHFVNYVPDMESRLI